MKKIVGIKPAPAKQAYPRVTKEFIYPGLDDLDDSFVSTAVLPMPNGMRVGVSLYDGKSSATFRVDIALQPYASAANSEASVKRWTTLLSALSTALGGLDATIRKAAQAGVAQAIKESRK